MNLAPVVIFTFNRLDHTKKTIESLMKNYLSKDTEVFIFSDGPRNKDEVIKVNEVRKYLDNIKGFKCLTIFKSDKNKGLANSVIQGVTEIIEKYNKIIVLEDDLITSKFFLKYMNDALEIYENRSDIWSISGYSPNINFPDEYKNEVYLTGRGSSWGWATWKNRWISIDWEIRDYNKFKNNRRLKKNFNNSGTDMSFMLEDQMKSRINSWAIRWCYNQFKQKKFTVYPIRSFVKNIGNDLSGTHTPVTNKYNVILSESFIRINENVEVDVRITREFKNFYDLKLNGYIGVLIKTIGMYKVARRVRNNLILCLRDLKLL